jgi:hypothetical protein
MTNINIVLTTDDFDFNIVALNDDSLEIMEKQEAKQEEMYNKIKVKFRGVQHALQSSRAVPTMPLPLGEPKSGDEPTQLHRLADAVEAHLRCA